MDDCFNSLKTSFPALTKSTLYKIFKINDVNRWPKDEIPAKNTKKGKFKKYEPGYFHVDITQVYTEKGKIYLFVAIDRTTKFCVVKVYQNQKAETAASFLRGLVKKHPIKSILY